MRSKLRIGVCPKDDCPSIGTPDKQCPRHIGTALIGVVYRIDKEERPLSDSVDKIKDPKLRKTFETVLKGMGL